MIKERCRHPEGCTLLIAKGQGYCTDHKPKANQNSNHHLRTIAEYRNNRTRILSKYPWCQKCWMEGRLAKGSCDHIVPLNKGGTNDLTNMQSLCLSCNVKKGTNSTKYPTYDVNTMKPGQTNQDNN